MKNETQKVMSSMQKKMNAVVSGNKVLYKKLVQRKAQNILDSEFKTYIRKNYPQIYRETVEHLKKLRALTSKKGEKKEKGE